MSVILSTAVGELTPVQFMCCAACEASVGDHGRRRRRRLCGGCSGCAGVAARTRQLSDGQQDTATDAAVAEAVEERVDGRIAVRQRDVEPVQCCPLVRRLEL